VQPLSLTRRRLLQALPLAAAGFALRPRLSGAAVQREVWPFQLHAHSSDGHDPTNIALPSGCAMAHVDGTIWFTPHTALMQTDSPRSFGDVPALEEVELRWENIFVAAAGQPVFSGLLAAPGLIEVYSALQGWMSIEQPEGEFFWQPQTDDGDVFTLFRSAAPVSGLTVTFARSSDETYAAWCAALPPSHYAGEERTRDPVEREHLTVFLPEPATPAWGTPASEWATVQNGVTAFAHPFGTSRAAGAYRAAEVDEAVNRLLATQVLGATMLEVYRKRGSANLRMHLEAWDRVVAAGFPVYGIGATDAHLPEMWATLDLATFFTAPEKPSRQLVIDKMRRGRMFFGFAGDWDPGTKLDYRVAGVPMGGTGAADWSQGVRFFGGRPRDYRMRATQFDESGYLLWEGRLSEIQERPSWVRLVARRDGRTALLGQWCRLL
jgi:hypothetical protein